VMDHRYIEEVDVIDRYLMGRLAAEESAEFEAHFVDCEQCIEHLNTTRAFIVGIRSVASDQAVHRIAPGRTYWWTQFTKSRKTLALVASVILVALAAGSLLLSREMRRARTEAAQANASAAEWRRRYEDQAASAANAQQNPQNEKDTQTSGPTNNESNKAGSENVAETGGAKKPRINVAIFVLSSTRGAGPSSGSRNLLRLSRAEDFVISVPLEGEINYVDYRMTLSRNRGGRIWESRELKADAHNLLTVEFNSSAFTSGDYELKVEGTTRERTTKIIGKYALTVVKLK